MTKNSPENKALMERFNVMGLFLRDFIFDQQNNEHKGYDRPLWMLMLF